MTEQKSPTLVDALIPVGSLIVMLAVSVSLFGDESSQGANQIVLIAAAAIATIVAVKNGFPWAGILRAIIDGISTAMGAILILLSVGALIGTWLLSGTVPSLIYYGLHILSPDWFYAAACIICALSSFAIGSSWTTAGTLGVALVGIAGGLGISMPITAGAIISGSYFGDKMSPLSDTTNLAPAVAGTDLFTHIRHMAWTTGPSFVIALLLYAILGFTGSNGTGNASLGDLQQTLAANFNINVLTLLPLAVVFYMASKKFPPLPTILFGALLGGGIAALMQPAVVIAYADSPDLSPALAIIKGVWVAFANGYVSATGVAEVDNLLSRGGMSNMLTTIWLIICALSFGAVLEHSGMLERLIRSALAMAKSTGSLIMTVVFSSIGINVIAADQYIAIVLPGKMYRAEFERRGLDPRNLSRTIEDAGTLTSPLVPWNTCGAYMSATLGVATLAYLPFAFLNLINPLIAIIYGYTGFKITRMEAKPAVA